MVLSDPGGLPLGDDANTVVRSRAIVGGICTVGSIPKDPFDTCIDQEDQESWTNRLIRRLRKLRERELGQA